MEQLVEILVVALQAAQHGAVVVGQREEGPRHPALGHGDAQLTPAIVVEDLDAFKAQLLQEGLRRIVDLQAVTAMPAGAQRGGVSLGEVEDALESERQQRDYLASLDQQLTLSRRTIDRIKDGYLHGAVNYLDVLQALVSQQSLERSQLQARRDLAEWQESIYIEDSFIQWAAPGFADRAYGLAWNNDRYFIAVTSPISSSYETLAAEFPY